MELVAWRVALVRFPWVLREDAKQLRMASFLWKPVPIGNLIAPLDALVTRLCTFVSRWTRPLPLWVLDRVTTASGPTPATDVPTVLLILPAVPL